MVLIPHDEYHSWIDTKKPDGNPRNPDLDIHSVSSSDSSVPTRASTETDISVIDNSIQHIDHSDSLTNSPSHDELISKIGTTVLDFLIRKGESVVSHLVGTGNQLETRQVSKRGQIPPPPGEPESKKKRLLSPPPLQSDLVKEKDKTDNPQDNLGVKWKTLK